MPSEGSSSETVGALLGSSSVKMTADTAEAPMESVSSTSMV